MSEPHGLKQIGYFDCPGGGQIVVEEGIAYIGHMKAPAGTSVVDVRDPRNPRQVAHFEVPAGLHSHKVRVGNGLMLTDGSEQPEYTGCHQPSEKIDGTEIPVAWFAHGLRIVDIKNPHQPTEVARFMPELQPGCDRVQSNDVTIDDQGRIYLLDRLRGMTILERI